MKEEAINQEATSKMMEDSEQEEVMVALEEVAIEMVQEEVAMVVPEGAVKEMALAEAVTEVRLEMMADSIGEMTGTITMTMMKSHGLIRPCTLLEMLRTRLLAISLMMWLRKLPTMLDRRETL